MNRGMPYPEIPSVTTLIELAYAAIGMQIGVDRKAQSRPIHDIKALREETPETKYEKPDVFPTVLEAVSHIPTTSAITEREGYEGLTPLLLEMANPKVASMVVNAQLIPIIRKEKHETSKGGIKWKASIRANNMPNYDVQQDQGVVEVEIYEMAPLNGGEPHNPERWKRFLSPYIISNIGLSIDIGRNIAELPPLEENNQENLVLDLVLVQESNTVKTLKQFIAGVVIEQAKQLRQRGTLGQMKNGVFADFARKELYEIYDSIPSDTSVWRKIIIGLITTSHNYSNKLSKPI
jgi:hypothetical protein